MLGEHWLLRVVFFGRPFWGLYVEVKSVGQVVTRPSDGGTRAFSQGRLEPFGNLAGFLFL